MLLFYDDDGHLCDPIATEFYIMPSLGKEIINGLPDLLGNYFEYFTTILERARLRKPAVRLESLQQLSLCREILCTPIAHDGNPTYTIEASRSGLNSVGHD